jgi:hypothetical protein
MTVQPSSRIRTEGTPALTIGSMASVMPGIKRGRLSLRPVIGNLGFLVQPAADTVTDELAHDGESAGSHKFFDRAAQIREFATGAGVFDGLEKRLFGDG